MLGEWIRKTDESNENQGWLGNSKWLRYILAALIGIGLLAVIWPGSQKVPVENTAVNKTNTSENSTIKASMTSELQSILSQVEGAGKVQVSLTLSSEGVKSYASNTKSEVRQTQETDKNSGERNIKEENTTTDIAVMGGSPMLVEDQTPEVLGVLVVADGAENATVRENLTYATATLLNISSHKVRVVAREVNSK
jgi:stage III sporulation protein AG